MEPYKGHFTGTLHGRLFSGVGGLVGDKIGGRGLLDGVAVGWFSGLGMSSGMCKGRCDRGYGVTR